MPNILFVLPSLDYHGDTRQAALLATALPRDQVRITGASLDGDGPLRPEFNRLGIPVEWHAGQRFMNFVQLGAMRHTVRDYHPDAIHVWGLPALRTLRLAHLGRWRRLPPVIISSAARSIRKGKLSWWNRRLLRRVAKCVVQFDHERDSLIAAGIEASRIVVIPPAVQAVSPPIDPLAFRREIGVPDTARLIMAAGRMDTIDRFRNAVWGFDVLKYLAPDTWLVLIGDGPARPRIEEFTRKLAQDDLRVAFAGARSDAARLLHLAEVVWVANRKTGATNVALEAMAAGKPVIASALPNLASVVRDGETGYLVAPRDAPGFARRTWQLMGNAELVHRMGEAGRHRAMMDFASSVMAEQFAQVYDEVANKVGWAS